MQEQQLQQSFAPITIEGTAVVAVEKCIDVRRITYGQPLNQQETERDGLHSVRVRDRLREMVRS